MPTRRRWSRIALLAALGAALIVLGATAARTADEGWSPARTIQFLNSMMTLPKTPLERIKGMTPDAVKKVLAFREGGKPFASLDEFKQVSGVTPQQFAQIATVFPEL